MNKIFVGAVLCFFILGFTFADDGEFSPSADPLTTKSEQSSTTTTSEPTSTSDSTSSETNVSDDDNSTTTILPSTNSASTKTISTAIPKFFTPNSTVTPGTTIPLEFSTIEGAQELHPESNSSPTMWNLSIAVLSISFAFLI